MSWRKNENKKNIIDLLKKLQKNRFKYRELNGQIDIFIPDCETFIHFNKFESVIFSYFFIENKRDIVHLETKLKKNFCMSIDRIDKKIEKFINGMLKL